MGNEKLRNLYNSAYNCGVIKGSKLVYMEIPLTYIQEVPNSNLGRDNGYSD
jgi:hypothetical protein